MRLRCSIAVLAGLTLPLAACGDSIPSRDEFIDQMSLTARSPFTKSLTENGVSKEKATAIFDEFVGCVYDKVSDDEALLQKIADEGTEAELNQATETKAKPCLDKMTSAVTSALGQPEG